MRGAQDPAPARLSLATLDRLARGALPPAVDPRALRPGIVHLGLGAFHRGHQAFITEQAMALSGESRWGIIGATQRSDAVVRQLRPQDGLYTLLEKGGPEPAARVIGAIRQALAPADEHRRIVDAIADAATAVVSLTVTEKGYRLGADRRLDLEQEPVAADAAALAEDERSRHAAPSRTAVGLLARGLAARAAAGAEPITVLSCDNLLGNGSLLEAAVRRLLEAAGGPRADRTLAWLDAGAAFPATMVDRMVPTTSAAALDEVERLIGVRDEAAVLGEPFWQWVIEDRFVAPRPAWELAGAVLTDDVAPYEQLKLRILNASHSLLAYLGALAGHATIAATIAQPAFEAIAWSFITEEVIPALELPEGVDPVEYARTVLERYRNAALGHQTLQVAMDGSQKLPLRLVPTIRRTLAEGREPWGCAVAFAAWSVFVARGADVAGRALPLDDPLAERLHAAAAGAPAGLADRMLALGEVFPEDLAGDPVWRRLFAEAIDGFASSDPAAWVERAS